MKRTVRLALLCSLLAYPFTIVSAQKITFAEHIEPIIEKNCAPCHRPGTAAPFSLLSYEDVSKRGKMIERVTAKRYMPPWKADPSYRHFANEKILEPAEISLISRWVNDGMERGKSIRKSKRNSIASATSINTRNRM